MAKPTKPTPPDRALRSNPSTFSANAEAWITYQWATFPDYIDNTADFVDGRADDALAAALGGDLPAITGQALKLLRVNAGETAAEFAAPDVVIPPLSQVQVEDDTSTVFGQVSGETLNQSIEANLNVTGTAPMYACRAWVNFNGTGAVAIRDSGNVSSITDNGTGDYTVNFTSAMPDNDYSVVGTVQNDLIANRVVFAPVASGLAVGSVRMKTNGDPGAVDSPVCSVAVFR